MKRLLIFIKKETVLTVSAILAILSIALVPIDLEYLHYLDFKVLTLLFGLMCIMAGFQSVGLFEALGRRMLSHTKNTRQLAGVLVALCFFSSMLITNDVALITFVPFTIMVLLMAERDKLLIPIIVLQTIAANLGSMLTPIGNPQNLYLYTAANFSLPEFISVMLPYTILSGLLLTACIFAFKPLPIPLPGIETAGQTLNKHALCRYSILFLLCLGTVLHLLPYQLVFIIILATLLCTDRKLLFKADYCLLFTFAFFFIFIGNMGRVDTVVTFLTRVLTGNELAVSVTASQVISNVPTALLLSCFTSQYKALLIGVNLGGLGTLIASLASLISYKFYVNTKGSDKMRYLLVFTLFNIGFLVVLIAASQAL